jgi:formylmethanofuran dehydrogenase subunit C
MVLRLRLRTDSQVPLEVEGITPDRLRDKSVAEIERLEMYQGNVKVCLAEFFDVSGDATDEIVHWEGDLAGVHWIGAKMTSGSLHVAGNAGRHVGSELTGGRIVVEGDVSDWLGGEMHGGSIHVRGRAGHLVGAAYRGSARGMTGGQILVDGDAGNEVGHTMRRGLVAIGGRVGDLVGFNMLAGTVLVLGDCGIRHGAGMRRGTLVFLGQTPPPLLPSFRHACRTRPVVMVLLLRHLIAGGLAVPEDLLTSTYQMYHGDLLEGGRGEILLRSQPR